MLNIKRGLLFLSIVLLSSCSSYKKVEVQPNIDKHFRVIVKILEDNEIKFNYNKIKSIRVSHIPGAQGVYEEKHKIIYINKGVRRIDWMPVYNEMLTLILAHEMAHSQGIMHNMDRTSIMNDSAYTYLKEIYDKDGLEKSIIEAFKLKN